MTQEHMNVSDGVLGSLIARAAPEAETMQILGKFNIVCFAPDGSARWQEETPNTVVTVGKNLILDQALAGSSYTAAEYLSLISSVGYTAIAAGDTMSSHSGWFEVDNATHTPYCGATRGTAAWSAASSGAKALSAALSFTVASNGTVQGVFMVGGSGASSTVGSTAGTLISASALGTPRAVLTGDTVQVSYTMTLT